LPEARERDVEGHLAAEAEPLPEADVERGPEVRRGALAGGVEPAVEVREHRRLQVTPEESKPTRAPTPARSRVTGNRL
jgi:hypothetical protein